MSRTEGDDSVFSVTADTGEARSRFGEYTRLFDIYVVAPFRVVWSDWRTRIGVTITLVYLLMGTVGVMVVSEPTISEGPQLLSPFQSLEFPLGTDKDGRGLFAMTVHATPAMLKMIAGGAVFSTTMSTIVGTLSGYKGGALDRALMILTDAVLTIPGLPLVIVIAAILQPREPFVIGVLLTINAWAGLARSIRSQVLTLRQESFVEASRVMGVPTPRIIRADILPNLMPYISIHFVNSARSVIYASVGLYFLGVLPYTAVNWGVMLNQAFGAGVLWQPEYIHWLLVPMFTILGLSFGLIMIAQGGDRLFNPRVRARHAKSIAGGSEEEPIDEPEDTGAGITETRT